MEGSVVVLDTKHIRNYMSVVPFRRGYAADFPVQRQLDRDVIDSSEGKCEINRDGPGRSVSKICFSALLNRPTWQQALFPAPDIHPGTFKSYSPTNGSSGFVQSGVFVNSTSILAGIYSPDSSSINFLRLAASSSSPNSASRSPPTRYTAPSAFPPSFLPLSPSACFSFDSRTFRSQASAW